MLVKRWSFKSSEDIQYHWHLWHCIFFVYVENTQLDDIIIKIIPENANIVYFKLITIQVRLLPHRHPDL